MVLTPAGPGTWSGWDRSIGVQPGLNSWIKTLNLWKKNRHSSFGEIEICLIPCQCGLRLFRAFFQPGDVRQNCVCFRATDVKGVPRTAPGIGMNLKLYLNFNKSNLEKYCWGLVYCLTCVCSVLEITGGQKKSDSCFSISFIK